MYRLLLGIVLLGIATPVRALPRKALKHLQCILTHYDEVFPLKDDGTDRCSKIEMNGPFISFHNLNYAVIVDYTVRSSHRRMYIVPIDHKSGHPPERFFVAHGRYMSPTYTNTVLAPNQNTILDAVYFSNVEGSNAPSSGLFVTGAPYIGEFHGPDSNNPLHSMIIHGVEPGINDNACTRATVFHSISSVQEDGKNPGVHEMSDGCWMVDYGVVESIIAKTAGSETEGGAVFFVYGPREAALPDDYYCK